MKPSLDDRRGLYFAFQGLLMAVLLLLFLYQYRSVEGWVEKFSFLTLSLGGSLLFLRIVGAETLSRWGVQVGLFLFDAALASVTLSWIQTESELYLIYFLIIFGTALLRDLGKSLLVALAVSLLFLLTAWSSRRGVPIAPDFWLRFLFLWIVSALLAILARDSQKTQDEQEKRFARRLIGFERLASLGQVAGEVAHRIKAPLTTILVNAEVLSHRLKGSKEAQAELARIREEVLHCREILKRLLDIGRIEEMDPRPIDLREPLLSALKALEPQVKRKNARLEASGLEEPLPLMGDQSLLHEAFAAVLQNALEALAERGAIRVSAGRLGGRGWWGGGGRSYSVVIEDDGKGIAPEHLDRLFKEFFTTKGREGSGLGLSSALRIVQKHGGTIDVHSDGRGKGSRFTIALPF